MNQKLLPHRFPFLLIDGTTNSEAGKWAAAYKNISENDWFITESQREVPFSLVVEAMAQTAACAGITGGDSLGLLSAVKKAERLGAALPGDRLDLFLRSRESDAVLCSAGRKRPLPGSLWRKLSSAYLSSQRKKSRLQRRLSDKPVILYHNLFHFVNCPFGHVCVFRHWRFPSALPAESDRLNHDVQDFHSVCSFVFFLSSSITSIFLFLNVLPAKRRKRFFVPVGHMY